MGQAIGASLPFAVGVAIIPLGIIAVILMLVSPRARVLAPAFLAGWVLGVFSVGAITLFFAGSADVATDPDASDGADGLKLVLGVVLLALAVRQWRGRPGPGEEAEMPGWMARVDTLESAGAVGIGVMLTVVNPKSLLLIIGGVLAIAQTDPSNSEALAALLVFVALCSVTVATPVALFFMLGPRAEPVLADWKQWLSVNNAAVMTVLFVVFGAVLIGQAVAGLS